MLLDKEVDSTEMRSYEIVMAVLNSLLPTSF